MEVARLAQSRPDMQHRSAELSRAALIRIQRELKEWERDAPDGCCLVECNPLSTWTIYMQGADGTLYADEVFVLCVEFSPNYPMESPVVVFQGQAPMHPHIYSNGHICLNVLYDDWSPALSITSVCLSLQSMLSSCTSKEWPPGNDSYVQRVGNRSPKLTPWGFHDDRV